MKNLAHFCCICLSLLTVIFGCDDTDGSEPIHITPDMERSVSVDAGSADAVVVMSIDSQVPVDMMTGPMLNVLLTEPTEGQTFTREETITVRGQISLSEGGIEFVSTTLRLDGNIDIPLRLDPTGRFETTLPALTGGSHQLTLTARLYPDITVSDRVTFSVECTYLETFDNDVNEDTWTVFGDHVGVTGSWLELTNNQVQTWSNMVLTGFPIRPNELDIEFDVSTGKCTEPGVCSRDRIHAGGGLAISIWNVDRNGFERVRQNHMGHFLQSPRKLAESGDQRPESFHIEFDTYSNFCGQCGSNQQGYDGCTNPYTDPSINNHVALHFNGHAVANGEPNPDNYDYCHLPIMGEDYEDYWADYPDLDDNRWHHVRVQIDGVRVRVWMGPKDEEQVLLIDLSVPGLVFKGGLLSISAGSGVNGNYHRVDNLQINAACN